jgi:serine/threonine protein kinase
LHKAEILLLHEPPANCSVIIKETLGVLPTHSLKSDVYSLGCLLYHLCTGRLPFPSPQQPDMVPMPIPDEYPSELRAIIMDCLQYDSARRPSSHEVVTRIFRAWHEASDMVELGAIKVAVFIMHHWLIKILEVL